jgi:hypothetical protein
MDKLELLYNKAIFVQKQINRYKELKKYKNHFGEMEDMAEMMNMGGMGNMIIIEEEEPYYTNEDPDWEGEMALTELSAIIDKAAAIRQMINERSELPAWIQSKITLASHGISAVHDFIKYNK